VVDPPPYRYSQIFRGPRHLVVDVDAVRSHASSPPDRLPARPELRDVPASVPGPRPPSRRINEWINPLSVARARADDDDSR
jgi:hypothetical protein